MNWLTFSVVAYDRDREQWGVGVASKFVAVGSVVPWVRSGVGAIATQAWANMSYGREGLKLLRNLSAEETVRKLTSEDPERDIRQLGVVDSKGNAYSYTGAKCLEFAGGITGDGYAVQGNILVDSKVIESMVSAMEQKGTLVERIINALRGAEKSGGDKRGKQSAAILIAGRTGSFDDNTDRVYDIRVDEHPNPVEELARIVEVWNATFYPDEMVPLEPNLEEIKRALERKGYRELESWAFDNNFDARISDGMIAQNVLRYLLE